MRFAAALSLLLSLTGCLAHQRRSQADEKLMLDYYGKPYLEAPKGWHWVCWNMPSDRCYIEKN